MINKKFVYILQKLLLKIVQIFTSTWTFEEVKIGFSLEEKKKILENYRFF